MTLADWLRLQRLYNLVQPDRLLTGVRDDGTYQPFAILEEKIRATDDEAGLRVQIATAYRNDQRKAPMHPDNDREYHMAELICACVNAIKPIMEQRMKEGKL